jgi:hypothetical protein
LQGRVWPCVAGVGPARHLRASAHVRVKVAVEHAPGRKADHIFTTFAGRELVEDVSDRIGHARGACQPVSRTRDDVEASTVGMKRYRASLEQRRIESVSLRVVQAVSADVAVREECKKGVGLP